MPSKLLFITEVYGFDEAYFLRVECLTVHHSITINMLVLT